MNWDQLPFINSVTQNRQAFGEKEIQISDDLNFLPEWLMCIMQNESGISSSIKNPVTGATGLIQFMDATAQDLGTSTADLATMSNVEQLDYVKEFFTKYGWDKHINDFGDAYLCVFYPEALFKTDDYVFPDWAVKANPSFDFNGDGILTKKEFKDGITAKYAAYLPAQGSAEVTALDEKKKLNLSFT